ncbi:MAG TPA: hypothetical protein VMY35_06130 [Phycisphaerae bacterium]|nr:hypothetical protein [Phycisphaerae bacterium]
MPKEFDECVTEGGEIRTVVGPDKTHGLGPDEYVHYCALNGVSHRGHVKKRKAKAQHGSSKD